MRERRRETKAVKTELQKKRTKWGRGGRRGGGGGGGGLCLLSAIGSGENIMQVRRDLLAPVSPKELLLLVIIGV